MSSWRLFPSVTAVLVPPYDKHGVYFCSPEKPIYQKKLSSYISSHEYSDASLQRVITIEDNSFQGRVAARGRFNLEVKSDEFPDKDAWYTVRNFMETDLVDLLYYSTFNEDHEIQETLEVVFNDDYPNLVSLTSPKLPGYMECFEELKRRLNCELLTKTRKMIPGHRYDSLNESRFILCKALYRKISDNNSKCETDLSLMPEVYLYVTNLKETDKTISDVLRTRKIGLGKEDIHISRTTPSLVDCGEVLTDDYTGDIYDYTGNLITNELMSETKIMYSHLFSAVSLLSSKSGSTIPFMTELEDATREMVRGVIKRYYEVKLGKEELLLSEKKSLEDNKKACMNLIHLDMNDSNVNRVDYYNTLFKTLNLDIERIIEEELEQWNPGNLARDFDTYVKNLEYFRTRQSYKVIHQRVNSTNYSMDVVKIGSLYSSELSKALIEAINAARLSGGYGIKNFAIYNVGTKRDPKEYIAATVTVEDLLSHIELSESLKNDIISSRFVELNIEFDKDKELE